MFINEVTSRSFSNWLLATVGLFSQNTVVSKETRALDLHVQESGQSRYSKLPMRENESESE